ncbi:MAG: ATP-dependent RecD-like DNA helicase [Defluviitaleaceae bacterium]|nr:ATP-dependent RecD-like DNA helicase [Defluviitaleaceae bacterium]
MDNFDNLQDLEQLEGTVERVIYASDDGDYTVFSMFVEDELGNSEEVVCTAGSGVSLGEDVKVYGTFTNHPSYGEQFKATVVERILPQTVSGMEAYLASGSIKGIGKKRAATIVEKFGLQTFQVLEQNPALLAEIKGITYEKAMEIGEAFAEKGAARNSIMYLQSLGLTVSQCEKVMKRYGGQAIDVVKNNPYVLAREVFGIGFKIADGIASKIGIAFNSPYRITAGIGHILLEGLGEGHVCLPRESLLGRVVNLLDADMGDIENQLLEMQVSGDIKQDKIADEHMIYLSAYYHSEVYIARRLLEISRINTASTLHVEREIERVERAEGIKLAHMQKAAVKEAMNHGVVVITGGPGTGKTTTIKTIIAMLDKLGQRVSLCAPTGRAAKRMNEATGKPAATIHRLLGLYQVEADNVQGEVDEDMKIKADCIIMDEASMVYSMLLFRLLKAMNDKTRLILVGDVNQLPSVGPGNVLKDIISSGKIPVVYLDEIFRQGQESAIVMNAHRINRGEYPIINERTNDFFFIKEPRMGHVPDIVADLNLRRLPSFTGASPIKDIQVLCPQRKTLCGVENLNKVLQEKLNPADPHKSEKQVGFTLFREGDKVMQIKNNYQTEWKILGDDSIVLEEGLGVFNGDEGLVEFIDNTNRIMRVAFYDDKIVDYPFKQLEELVLAYAITIHKSQGSEYDVVILPLHSGTPLLFNRNLLYTAVTRAKKLVVIVGVEGTINRMVDNVRESVRHTALSYRLERFYEQLYVEEEQSH